jgi:hypothetical protein
VDPDEITVTIEIETILDDGNFVTFAYTIGGEIYIATILKPLKD